MEKSTHCTPVQWQAENNGWELKNGYYEMKWFIGDQMPQEIYKIGQIDSPEDSDEESTYDSDSSSYDSE